MNELTGFAILTMSHQTNEASCNGGYEHGMLSFIRHTAYTRIASPGKEDMWREYDMGIFLFQPFFSIKRHELMALFQYNAALRDSTLSEYGWIHGDIAIQLRHFHVSWASSCVGIVTCLGVLPRNDGNFILLDLHHV